jgi:hypothetical protein
VYYSSSLTPTTMGVFALRASEIGTPVTWFCYYLQRRSNIHARRCIKRSGLVSENFSAETPEFPRRRFSGSPVMIGGVPYPYSTPSRLLEANLAPV